MLIIVSVNERASSKASLSITALLAMLVGISSAYLGNCPSSNLDIIVVTPSVTLIAPLSVVMVNVSAVANTFTSSSTNLLGNY